MTWKLIYQSQFQCHQKLNQKKRLLHKFFLTSSSSSFHMPIKIINVEQQRAQDGQPSDRFGQIPEIIITRVCGFFEVVMLLREKHANLKRQILNMVFQKIFVQTFLHIFFSKTASPKMLQNFEKSSKIWQRFGNKMKKSLLKCNFGCPIHHYIDVTTSIKGGEVRKED